nr:anti-sigma factor [Rhizobium sp. G21]
MQRRLSGGSSAVACFPPYRSAAVPARRGQGRRPVAFVELADAVARPGGGRGCRRRLVRRRSPPSAARGRTARPPLVAELTGEKNGFNLVATYDFGTGRLSVIPAALRQDGPKSLEVWVIEDGKPPLSVGVLPDTGRGDIVIPTSLRASFTAGRTIAITVEPLGGSPTASRRGR